jgi:putative peptide-modifying radical SAM enzyme
MLYHIITTPECNLCCAYCCEKAFSEPEKKKSIFKFISEPQNPTYSLEELNSFLLKDKDNIENKKEGITLTFYGGEPLLNTEFIKKLMDFYPKKNNLKLNEKLNSDSDSKANVTRFMMQTNGVLLNKLPKEYVNRFHTILVSIDGDKKITDANRGEGTYDKVISNLNFITKNGFKGELIARMTIEEPVNAFDCITYLAKNKDFSFKSIHWQLDANMWQDYSKRKFSKWSKEYNLQITKLSNWWINQLKKENVIRLYPFMGILDSILNGEKYFLRCGSGVGNFTITPSGMISVCPIMTGVKSHYLGSIKTAIPDKLPFKIKIKEPCTSCDYFDLCGGRCLYSNLEPAWPSKGVKEVCGTVIHLIEEMKRIAPQLKKLIDKKIVSKKSLEMIKYNGAEIIP